MKYSYKFIIALVAIISIAGCTNKLDLKPTNDITADVVYATPLGYKQALAKLYGSMALVGNSGATNSRDIPSQIISDAGNSDFLRPLWYLQCLTTDEAGWTYHSSTDPINIHELSWSSVNEAVSGLYYRCFFNIALANDFIRQSADDKVSGRGITGSNADDIKKYRAEARFIRAYNYWVLMDCYGNPPFVTENDAVGASLPKQIKRKDLFNYIETELKAIDGDLVAPKTNEYGRADKAAAWSLLARMYLNAEVYTGSPRYTDAITYSKQVISAGYTLHPKYKELMLADNNLNTDEFILTINFDGQNSQNYGGTTLLTHGPSADNTNSSIAQAYKDSSGTNGTWRCIRVTQQFVDLFNAQDIRGQFWVTGQNKNMTQLLDVPTDGYSSTKFRNKTRTGAPAPHRDQAGDFVDIDFPMFRLGEIYLIYAESVIRGGTGGDNATALGYLRQLATRARPNDPNAANVPQMTLQYIIDERGRELFWECCRRTDLVRFNMFTTSAYLWAWKGGVAGGTAVDSKYNLFPIPSIDLTANPNLVQNPGY